MYMYNKIKQQTMKENENKRVIGKGRQCSISYGKITDKRNIEREIPRYEITLNGVNKS